MVVVLTAHERTVLKRLAVEIEARDPALARRLSWRPARRAPRLVGRALLLVATVAIGPLLAFGLLVGGLDGHIEALTILGAIAVCAALPASASLAHHVNRRLAPP